MNKYKQYKFSMNDMVFNITLNKVGHFLGFPETKFDSGNLWINGFFRYETSVRYRNKLQL